MNTPAEVETLQKRGGGGQRIINNGLLAVRQLLLDADTPSVSVSRGG